MEELPRTIAKEIAQRYICNGDALGWFEALYSEANGDASVIPWADLIPNPNLVSWLDACNINGKGKTALKVGCGLGDDAEELAQRGFTTTAFDISETAIAWCRRRFPESPVKYLAVNLFKTPDDWRTAFDLVLESYTLQVLPPNLRDNVICTISNYVAPSGTLLVITRGKESIDPKEKMPWPLTRFELEKFTQQGLSETSFEDYIDEEDPPVRRFRAVYVRQ